MDMKITRGTTPTLNFILPFSTSEINKIYFTFHQNGKLVFEKDNSELILVDINTSTENGFVIDENSDDEFSSNDAYQEEQEEQESYCNCSIHLSQEDTLGFTFYAAAEKNIAYCQFRIVDKDEEAYASDPLNFRIYGVLRDGEIGVKWLI